jgi:hypothetical protein
MNINYFLSNKDNFNKVQLIYENSQKNLSLYDKTKITSNDGLFYMEYPEVIRKNELISYDNDNMEIKKIISIIEQLNLISDCENIDMKWLDLLYSDTYPNCTNDLKIFMLSAIGKLLKENKNLKDRLTNLELCRSEITFGSESKSLTR